MAENNQGGQQQIQLQIDESKMHTTYANTIRTSTTPDEVVMDFGMNLPMPQQQGQQQSMLFSVGGRVVMNWGGAKRLAISLAQVVRQFEERNGEIQINAGQRPAAGGGAPKLVN